MGIKLWHLEYDTFEKRSGREKQEACADDEGQSR
jgi:hypothetical protein